MRDHPRMRGEHIQASNVMRIGDGIIPACAGSTPSDMCVISVMQGSSPHARGARVVDSLLMHIVGDHPRMRGEHRFSHAPIDSGRRIIPACAGSTVLSYQISNPYLGSSPHARGALALFAGRGILLRDHPRMRGEHDGVLAGESPYLGIIPACAGSTAMRFSSRNPFQDHPRMRGEHFNYYLSTDEQVRIIPACAGSTFEQ